MTETAQKIRFRIGVVAKRTGITTHTIRVWERRYGAVCPERTEGGDRLYCEDDIRRLSMVRVLTQAGHAVSRVACLPLEKLESLAQKAETFSDIELPDCGTGECDDTGEEECPAVSRALRAIDAYDVDRAREQLLRATYALSPIDFVDEVALPFLRRLDDAWRSGAFNTAKEHLASALLRTAIELMGNTVCIPSTKGTAVVSTLSDERHEFGALLCWLLARAHGWKVVYLGVDLPTTEIVEVVCETNATLLLLSCVRQDRQATQDDVRGLERSLPESCEIFLGGRGAEGLVTGRAHRVDFDGLSDRLAGCAP